MIAQTAYPNIESYAKFDFEEIIAEANEKWGFDIQLLGIDIKEEIVEEGVESVYTITGTFLNEGEKFKLTYQCVDNINYDELVFDEITMYDIHDAYMHRYYMSMNMRNDAQYFEDRLNKRGIKSTTAIMAADEDEDPFADMSFDDEDEPAGNPDLASQEDTEDIADSIDEMSDTLDDLNDALDEIEEDDINIEVENNITDHFIAECEKCQGIFITSVVESDQQIDSITGVCPLCDEECEQIIKWVIKEI